MANLSHLVNEEMLKLGAAYYHVRRCGEIDQPHIIGGGVHVETELSDSGAKDIFLPDLSIKISENDFCVMDQAPITHVLEFSVEGIFNSIILLFRRCVSTYSIKIFEDGFCIVGWALSYTSSKTNKADVIEFYPDAYCGYSFVHRHETRDKMVNLISNTNPHPNSCLST